MDTETANVSVDYPVRLSVDYPDRPLDRLTTLLRPIVAIPILILIGLVSGPGWDAGPWTIAGTGGLLVVPTALMILVTGRYPRPAFDFVVGVARRQARVAGYATLLTTDRYPPFSLR